MKLDTTGLTAAGHKCELCYRQSYYVDSVTDVVASRQGQVAYRLQYLCRSHGISRQFYGGNTSRVTELPDATDFQ